MLALRRAVLTRVLPLVRFHPARSASTAVFDAAIHNFGADLRQKQPAFSVPANGIQILSQPSEFYALILVRTCIEAFLFEDRRLPILGHDSTCSKSNISLLALHRLR